MAKKSEEYTKKERESHAQIPKIQTAEGWKRMRAKKLKGMDKL